MDQHYNSMSQGYPHANFDAVQQDFDFSGFSSQYNQDPIPQPATPFYSSPNQYPGSPGPQQGQYQSPYLSSPQQLTYAQQSQLRSPAPIHMTGHLNQARLPLQSRQTSTNEAVYMNTTATMGSLATFGSNNVAFEPFPAPAPQAAPNPQAALEPEGKENRNGAKSATGTKAPRSKATTAAKRGAKKNHPGKGALSGPMNRRDQGGSDDEVDELTPEQKDAAKLKLPSQKAQDAASEATEKKKVTNIPMSVQLSIVKYILQPKIYVDYKLKQDPVHCTISQSVLKPAGVYSPKQVKDCFNRNLAKYKAVRLWLKVKEKKDSHTGGGDGDEDRIAAAKRKKEAGAGEGDGDDEEEGEGDDEAEGDGDVSE
ncbi:hypothetical protein DFP72DRAFT_880914, partial [Ephemerocybe angulata]